MTLPCVEARLSSRDRATWRARFRDGLCGARWLALFANVVRLRKSVRRRWYKFPKISLAKRPELQWRYATPCPALLTLRSTQREIASFEAQRCELQKIQ
jgi:hypothetical protein